jgi:hypothetical protein
VSAVGLGGAAWWLVRTNRFHALDTGRIDQLAWLLALGGLVVLALEAARRAPRVWPAVALLSAALWTKQTTIGAAAAAVAVAAWWAATGVIGWAGWWRLTIGLVGVNVAALALLVAVTDGWAWFFLFELPSRHDIDPASLGRAAELAGLLALPAAAVCIAGGAAWWRRRGEPRQVTFAGRLGVVLVAFLVLQVVPSWSGRLKQGGFTNQYVGLTWALGLLLALAHREARRTGRGLGSGLAAYVLVVMIALVPPVRAVYDRPDALDPTLFPRREIRELPADVVDYARSHLVYNVRHGVVSTERTSHLWPSQPNLMDLLAAGETSGHLVDALVERRFDAVTRFDVQASRYVSRSGRTSAGYLPALNALIDLGYEKGANAAPPPLLGRRAERVDLRWARACFDGDAEPAACVAAGPDG